jgi:glycosyltransferase involved in cell wall biosynthesis
MKIAYLMEAGVPNIFKQPPSGPTVHVTQVFKELSNIGNHLSLLAKLEGSLLVTSDMELFNFVDLPCTGCKMVRLFERIIHKVQSLFKLPYGALFENLRFARACINLFAEYDLLYERMGWLGYGGAIASKVLKIPLVFEVNGDHINELKILGYSMRGIQLWLSTRLMSFAMRQASLFVATGEGWKRRLIEQWGVDPNRIVVIENGTEIVHLLRREQLRSFRCDIASDDITIIYVGGFEPWHGLPVLIKAIHMLIGRKVQAQLVLIGSGSEQFHIESIIQELKLEKFIKITGQLNMQDMVGYLAQADISVSPYCGRSEFSGLKLLDYKAAGLATVASGINGEPFVITHGRTGLIVPPCDEDELCEALYILSTNPSLRKEMGRTARLEAEEMHSWKHTANNLNEILSSLIK